MTRDEAIRAASRAINSGGDNAMEKWVNVFAALGMLKLEEPLNSKDKFKEAMRHNGVYLSAISIDMALAQAGLKIVEE